MESLGADRFPHTRGRQRPIARKVRILMVALVLGVLAAGTAAFAASKFIGADPLNGPPAPAENDAALHALFPPYQIGHATQLAANDGRTLFGARTRTGGYCFSATSPVDPKAEGGTCVSKAEARKLDAGGTVAFTMSGWSAGGYAPGAREVRVTGAGIDTTIPVAANGWWVGVARLPLGADQLRSPLPQGQDRGFVIATSIAPDGHVLGQARLMIVTVTRDKSGRILTVGFAS